MVRHSQKRLVTSPKVYSGLSHDLAHFVDHDTLLGHPLGGPSWEGFVIENLLAQRPDNWQASYYRTSAQAEVDLVLTGPRRQVLAIEIQRTLSPTLSKGLRNGIADVDATRGLCVMPQGERFPLAKNIEAVPLAGLISELPELVG